MNVSADVMVELARVLGAPGETKAEGVARLALERLRGEKEWWVEVFDGSAWEFHSLGYLNATEARSAAREQTERWGHEARVVELIKRVLS